MNQNKKAKEEWEKKQAEAEKVRKLNEVCVFFVFQIFSWETKHARMHTDGIFYVYAHLIKFKVLNLTAYSLRVAMELMVIKTEMKVVLNHLRYVNFA